MKKRICSLLVACFLVISTTSSLWAIGNLNDNEKEAIKRYNQGEALFICGSRRMRIHIICTQEELDSFGAGGGI